MRSRAGIQGSSVDRRLFSNSQRAREPETARLRNVEIWNMQKFDQPIFRALDWAKFPPFPATRQGFALTMLEMNQRILELIAFIYCLY